MTVTKTVQWMSSLSICKSSCLHPLNPLKLEKPTRTKKSKGFSLTKILNRGLFACEIISSNSTPSKFINVTEWNLEAHWALTICDADDAVLQWHCTNHPQWPITYLLFATANSPCAMTWGIFFPLPDQVPHGHIFLPKASLHLRTVFIDWARGVRTVSN